MTVYLVVKHFYDKNDKYQREQLGEFHTWEAARKFVDAQQESNTGKFHIVNSDLMKILDESSRFSIKKIIM